jgi:hypothetical protein
MMGTTRRSREMSGGSRGPGMGITCYVPSSVTCVTFETYRPKTLSQDFLRISSCYNASNMHRSMLSCCERLPRLMLTQGEQRDCRRLETAWVSWWSLPRCARTLWTIQLEWLWRFASFFVCWTLEGLKTPSSSRRQGICGACTPTFTMPRRSIKLGWLLWPRERARPTSPTVPLQNELIHTGTGVYVFWVPVCTRPFFYRNSALRCVPFY